MSGFLPAQRRYGRLCRLADRAGHLTVTDPEPDRRSARVLPVRPRERKRRPGADAGPYERVIYFAVPTGTTHISQRLPRFPALSLTA